MNRQRLSRWLHHQSTTYHRIPYRVRFVFKATLLVAIVILTPLYLHESRQPSGKGTAEYYFLPGSTELVVGQNFPVELRLKTHGTAVNAQGFILKYNPYYLEATGMTTEQSFCQFYLENVYDNLTGEVRVSCGAPRPGFLGDALAVHVTFQVKNPGTTNLSLDPKHIEILANDGKGSNINKGAPELTVSIQHL